VKINNKIKILNVNKLKFFHQNEEDEENQKFLDYNFKNAAQLALLMLKEESGLSDYDFDFVDSLCSEPCPSCDYENEYFKLNLPKRNFPPKCDNCQEFKKLFLKLKECEEQCFQLKQ